MKKLTLVLILVVLIMMEFFFSSQTETQPPKVVLDEMGESLPNVQTDSSYVFDLSESLLKGHDIYHITEPFTFQYTPKDGSGFTLHSNSFAQLDLYMGHVVEVQIQPHLAFMNIEQAIEKTHQISQKINQKHWHQMTHKHPLFQNLNDNEIRDYFNHRSTHSRLIVVRAWQDRDGVTTRILLYETHIPVDLSYVFSNSPKNILLEVRIEDGFARKHYAKAAAVYESMRNETTYRE